MVEFGLKLSDNQVADWREHYIDYEKLKAILTKCSLSVKRLEEVSLRKPGIAASITEAYKAGLPTPHASVVDLPGLLDQSSSITKSNNASSSLGDALKKIVEDASEHGSADADPSETTELRRPTSGFYGTTNTDSSRSSDNIGAELDPVDSKGNLLSRAFVKATSGVTDYFQKNYERTLRDTLKEIDAIAEEFDVCFHENIARVNTFYTQKLEELEGRVVYLKESVTDLRQVPGGPPPAPFDDEYIADEDNNETPLVSHRKSATKNPIAFAKAVARNFTSQMRHRPHSKSEISNSSESAGLLTGEGAEDDALEEIDPETARKVREAESIQRALVDNYRTAKLLSNFAIMNYTGFVKIIKKYDKTMPSDRKGKYKKEIKTSNICNEGKAVEALAARMEKLYANWFCDRNVSEARAQMLTKKGDVLEMDWSQLRLGYRMGMCSILALWVCWDCVWGLMTEGQSTIGGRTAFPVFRACAGLLTLQWCWGFSVWVWTRYRVNYIYLFDFNPSIVASPLVIFNAAVDNTLTYFVCALLYYKAGAHDIPVSFPAGIFPFILVLCTIYQLIFPLRTRAPMWETIWQVVTAPTTSPTFFHGYVGDIFTSLVKVFQDLAWTVFFVFSGDWLISEDLKASTKHSWSRTAWYTNILIPLLTLLPLWFRFNQCLRRYTDTGKRFPHLANACKYALSQTVTLFGAFHPLYMRNNRESEIFQLFWMCAFIASSLYSFWWDLFMVRLFRKGQCYVARARPNSCVPVCSSGLGPRTSREQILGTAPNVSQAHHVLWHYLS
jgi:EXS family/SPX domain